MFSLQCQMLGTHASGSAVGQASNKPGTGQPQHRNFGPSGFPVSDLKIPNACEL